jgi:hypothetical protein
MYKLDRQRMSEALKDETWDTFYKMWNWYKLEFSIQKTCLKGLLQVSLTFEELEEFFNADNGTFPAEFQPGEFRQMITQIDESERRRSTALPLFDSVNRFIEGKS